RTTGGDPRSRNFVTLPTGSAVPSSPAFSPPITPSDVQFEPRCTAPETPPSCLIPCPICGNGQTEVPEPCDHGAGNGPCHACSPRCRTIDCNDGDACTTDACDVIVGCTHPSIPNCSTTTTAPPTTTSTTTPSTTSTSTIPPSSTTTSTTP